MKNPNKGGTRKVGADAADYTAEGVASPPESQSPASNKGNLSQNEMDQQGDGSAGNAANTSGGMRILGKGIVQGKVGGLWCTETERQPGLDGQDNNIFYGDDAPIKS
jgi:hypothetical protein